MALINWNWTSPDMAANTVKTINDAANTNYEESRKRTWNAIQAAHLDPHGNITPGLGRDIAESGLGFDQALQSSDYYTKQQQAPVANAAAWMGQQQLGVNPYYSKRPGGSDIPEPTQPATDAPKPRSGWADKWLQPIKTPAEPGFASVGAGGGKIPLSTIPSVAYDSNGDVVGQAGGVQSQAPAPMQLDLDGRAQPVPAPIQILTDKDAIQQDNDQFLQTDDAQTNAKVVVPVGINQGGSAPAAQDQYAHDKDGSIMTNANGEPLLKADNSAPVDLGAGGLTAHAPVADDDLMWYQRPAFGWKNPMSGTNTTASDKPDPDIVKWDVKDDGSDQFRQYQKAQTSMISSVGAKNGTDYLTKIWDATYKANMPVAPNWAEIVKNSSNASEGLAKYQEQVQQYQAGLTQAKGKADLAVMAEKQKLQAQADKFGVQSVTNSQSYIADSEGGMHTLRDVSKRNEAASVLQNESLTNGLKEEINAASRISDTPGLLLMLPRVARLYGGSMKPGEQPSEFNVTEITKALYPELTARDVGMALTDVWRLIKTGGKDLSLINDMQSKYGEMKPAALRGALGKMMDDIDKANASNHKAYLKD